jgi:ankyrin repeat protein
MGADDPLSEFADIFAEVEARGLYADNVEHLRKLLDGGASPDAVGARGYPLTIEAVKAGRSDCLELLLSRGARVDGPQGFSAKPPLIWAASQGDVRCVEVLLAHGADIDREGEFGMTPLMHACWQGRFEAAKLLVEAGADIEASDGEMAVVHYAAQSGSSECLAMLASHGARLDSRLESGGDVGHIAARNPRFEALLAMLELGVDLNRPDSSGKRALDIAEVNGLSASHLKVLKSASFSKKEREALDITLDTGSSTRRSVRV